MLRRLRSILRACRGLIAAAFLGACATLPPAMRLDAQQQAEVQGAETYLNNLRQFQARFAQYGAFGGGGGWIWVDRPGKLRISYDGPQGQDMVANHGVLVIVGRADGSRTTMPVARTALGLLLGERIDLSGATVITAISDDHGVLTLALRHADHPEQGTLTLDLLRNPWSLKRVVASDARGRSLALELTDLQIHPNVSADVFVLPAAH